LTSVIFYEKIKHTGKVKTGMLPKAFLDRMQLMLGDEYARFLASFEQDRYQALRLNALKRGVGGKSAAELLCPGQDFSFRIPGGTIRLWKVPWAENGYYYGPEARPGKNPFHEAGVYYIQEPSAMAPAELLEACPGERILDLCAAPGGKSTQIAAKMQGKGFLLCNEIHPARAKILSENIERQCVANAYVTNETPEHLAEIFPEYFDKILVDAPCSGEGMFRKNEASCGEWSPENVALCAKRQDGILDCAAEMLRPGGRLVYSTCTFAPAEDEGSICRFLERHKDFILLPIRKEAFGETGCDGSGNYLEGMQALSVHLEDTLRLWPQRIHGEGHFAAVLQKVGKVSEGYKRSSLNGPVRTVRDKELGEYPDFCKENFSEGSFLRQGQEYGHIRFGDNIYRVSEEMPSVNGLKVLRPGLHMGVLKKNRFEPAHALALLLSPEDAVHVWNLSCAESAAAYLNGQTFPAQGVKGWYLICVDGFSIGWGKLAGGIMKNHYPRGLRL